jgi:hypothetical protein
MTTTYRLQAEKILTTFYRGQRSDDSNFSLKHVAQLISEEWAAIARQNAFENSNAGETTYANDTFIATFKNIAVQTDDLTGDTYIQLPAIPTALPSNQEVQKIIPILNGKVIPKKQIVLMPNRAKFAQDMLPPVMGFVTAYIEDTKIVFDNTIEYNFSAVNINLIGAMPDGALLDTVLQLPKNYEALLSEKVIARLMSTANRQRDTLNDEVSIPS